MKSSDDSDQYDVFDDDLPTKTPIGGPVLHKKSPMIDNASPDEENEPIETPTTEHAPDARAQKQPAETEEQEDSAQQPQGESIADTKPAKKQISADAFGGESLTKTEKEEDDQDSYENEVKKDNAVAQKNSEEEDETTESEDQPEQEEKPLKKEKSTKKVPTK